MGRLEEATYRAGLLNAVLLTGALMTVLVMLANAADSHTPIRNYFIDLAILAGCLHLHHLPSKGRLRLVGILGSSAAFAFVMAVVASEGSVLVPGTSLFLLLVVTAGILFGLSGVVVSALASSLAVGG